MNTFKTSDIKIHADSQGSYDCTHKYQGTLIDGDYFANRNEARRAAVEELRDIQENGPREDW